MPKELQSRVWLGIMNTSLIQEKNELKKQYANAFIGPAYAEMYALFVRRARNVSLVRKHAENMDICKQKKQNQILGLKSILI
jgi:hypothetical protein